MHPLQIYTQWRDIIDMVYCRQRRRITYKFGHYARIQKYYEQHIINLK
jgi:hypothetical protein